MKAIFSLLGLFLVISINAQKFDCSAKITTYQELFLAQNMSETFDTWSEVRKKCPKENETIYTDGFKILQFQIDNAANAEEKETWVRDELKLYDQYHINFPLTTSDYEVSKAMTLYDNKIDAKEEIFGLLQSGFAKASNHITNASAIYTYFSLCFDNYKAGDKKFTAEVVLDKYMLVNFMLTQLQVSNAKKISEYKTAQRGINALARDLATCDNLGNYYTNNYSKHSEDVTWITTALTNLSGKCSAKPIFNTMAEKLYAVKVTSESAYFMAAASTKQRKFKEAIAFYNEAADLETNPEEKAKIYYTLATGLLANDMTKSRENLNKALAFDPKMGKAYIFLAQLYSDAAEKCGQTDFEKKAIFYLAQQTVKKAGMADSKLKQTADKMSEDYTKKALTQSEIKKAKMNGKSIKIDCWINETITFPHK
jgi:hypothetical protein